MEVLNFVAFITDINEVCRTCLTVKKSIEDLCYLYSNNLDSTLEEVSSCSKPILEDGLPGYICKRCVTHLNFAFNFKKQCQKSEQRLKNVLLISVPQKSSVSLKELLSTDLKGDHQFLNNALTVDAASQTNVYGKRRKKVPSPINDSDNDQEALETATRQPSPQPAEISNKNDKNSTVVRALKCENCTKVFRSITGLRIHSLKHGVKLSCQVCDKKFMLNKQLNKHMRLHKDYKPYSCKVCKKSFSARGNLSKHMRIHGGEKKHLCVICGRRFFEPGHLAIHMRTHTGEKPIVCTICSKRFADPHGLIAHNKIHTGERKYECKECGKRFAHSFVLTAHIRTHTGERPYQCSICGISYATSSYLTIHKRTHTQERPFRCEFCPKAFVSRCALVAHNMTHTGEKKFQCNVCGKRVARAADLNIHMRSHTGEKPYCCDQCPKRYHTSSNLSAHKRTHSGIKNHICSICDKAFGDARVLKGHLRIHTGEKPYVCQMCGKQYSQSGQLAAHRKTHAHSKLRGSTKAALPQQSSYDLHQNLDVSLENSLIYSHETVISKDAQFVSLMDSGKEVDQLEMKSIFISESQGIPVQLDSCELNTTNFYAEITPLTLTIQSNHENSIEKMPEIHK